MHCQTTVTEIFGHRFGPNPPHFRHHGAILDGFLAPCWESLTVVWKNEHSSEALRSTPGPLALEPLGPWPFPLGPLGLWPSLWALWPLDPLELWAHGPLPLGPLGLRLPLGPLALQIPWSFVKASVHMRASR